MKIILERMLLVLKIVIGFNLLYNIVLLCNIIIHINEYMIVLINAIELEKTYMYMIALASVLFHIGTNILIILILLKCINIKKYIILYIIFILFIFLVIGLNNKSIFVDIDIYQQYKNNYLTMYVVDNENIKNEKIDDGNTIRKIMITISVITYLIVVISNTNYIHSLTNVFKTNMTTDVVNETHQLIPHIINNQVNQLNIDERLQILLIKIKKIIGQYKNQDNNIDIMMVNKIKKCCNNLTNLEKEQIYEKLLESYNKLPQLSEYFDWYRQNQSVLTYLSKQLEENIYIVLNKNTIESTQLLLSQYKNIINNIASNNIISIDLQEILLTQMKEIREIQEITNPILFLTKTSALLNSNMYSTLVKEYSEVMNSNIIPILMENSSFSFLTNMSFMSDDIMKDTFFNYLINNLF